MWTVRAVRIEDLDALESLVRSATRGLTSLQLTRAQILDRIEQSVFAFSRTGLSTKDEPYVLVLANNTTGELIGTSTIYAKTGGFQPFYTYKIVTEHCTSHQLQLSHERSMLALNRLHDGPTEIGSLFLRGARRGQGFGRWLSLARFAVIASRRQRFSQRVIAEMRGKAERDGSIPFWSAVTGRFIPVEFAIADAMSTVSKEFIESLMPKHPIYLDLLPPSIREVIGQVHDETLPAVALLEGQGFRRTDEVDIFDAGPVLSCETDKIFAVRQSQSLLVEDVTDDGTSEQASDTTRATDVILSTSLQGFTSVQTRVCSAAFARHSVTLGRSIAKQLCVEPGDVCMATPLHKDPAVLVAS